MYKKHICVLYKETNIRLIYVLRSAIFDRKVSKWQRIFTESTQSFIHNYWALFHNAVENFIHNF